MKVAHISLKKFLKKSLSWLHLWLGLISGLVVFVSMLGAAVFVWEEELTQWYHRDLVYVSEVGKELIPPSELFCALESVYPDRSFRRLSLSSDPEKSYYVSSFKRIPKEQQSWTSFSTVDRYERIYINPYTAEVLGVVDLKYDWIQLSRRLHQDLLLYPKVGQMIVGIAALVMIILAFSGLYLWWPKNYRMLKTRLKVKWDARWRRLNWDIHSVGGFYTFIFVLFFASTGLVWTFDWWRDGVYKMLGNDPKEVFAKHEQIPLRTGPHTLAIDRAFEDAIHRKETWYKMSFRIPAQDRQKGEISASIRYHDPSSGWETSDQYAYHPETGELYWDRRHEEKLLGEKWRNSNYALHVGSIYGTLSKIIAFICALFFAILPVSGFLIWWGRKNKKASCKSASKRPNSTHKAPQKR